ncbi:deoxyribonuclease V [Halomonas campisalis]|uniref:Endonuclease V n=1 Tax=Billgrantia campisalis TaxID=74661 RepID=A0ABS9PC50_9GAMM|nr:deoxyribonuclease V [Halomonas campisalis]MCG6659350.1 deoxyribonuclease V [Halomonas campisalis]MDR5863952.1 deoxyribonuclease V [Halomonas campisalis]
MTAVPLHDWDLAPREAIALQRRLAGRVERADRLGPVRHIAGVDIGFEAQGEITRAAVVVLAWPGAPGGEFAVVEEALHREPTRMPYVPGLLSFREVPAALAAFEQLTVRPDLVMVDGQGIAHPRRLGVASHLGLWLDLPTIGVAKSRLCGRHGEPGPERGDWSPLTDGPEDEVIGAVLRSRAGVKPIFVSPGHRLSLTTALHWVTACLGRTKLPEPTRLADRLASRRGEKSR